MNGNWLHNADRSDYEDQREAEMRHGIDVKLIAERTLNLTMQAIDKAMKTVGQLTGQDDRANRPESPMPEQQPHADQELTKNCGGELDLQRMKYFRQAKGLQDYQLRFVNTLMRKIDLRGKTVLEIGGSNLPNELVFGDMGAKKWVCVDKFWDVHTKLWPEHYSVNPIYRFGEMPLAQAMSSHDYVIYNEPAELIGAEFFDTFDVCISLCSFEHVQNLVTVLNRIHSSLVQQGKFFTQFGPIWSSCGGSHFWVSDDLNFNKRHPLPDHAHLLLSYPQILDVFLTLYDMDEAQWYAYNLYTGHRCDVNGFFYEDYEQLMAKSNFLDYKVSPSVISNVDSAAMLELQKRYYPYKRFDVWEIEMSATKTVVE